MKLSIEHTTSYQYSREVSFSRNEVRLKPREYPGQTLDDFTLTVTPEAQIRYRSDYYDNPVHVCKVFKPHRELEITSTSLVTTRNIDSESNARFSDLDLQDPGLQEFLLPTDLIPLDEDWSETFGFPTASDSDEIFDYIEAVMDRLEEQFEYNPSATDVGTDLHEFSRHHSGVCQDFAHSMLAICRQENLPARYVSGYIETGQGSEASHAWLQAYVPGTGWVGFDPTNNRFTNDRYVVLALGRDYSDCSPVKGIRRGGGEDSMSVSVSVRALDPEPR